MPDDVEDEFNLDDEVSGLFIAAKSEQDAIDIKETMFKHIRISQAVQNIIENDDDLPIKIPVLRAVIAEILK